MSVWDLLIALSGLEDYAVRTDDNGEHHIVLADDLRQQPHRETATVIKLNK